MGDTIMKGMKQFDVMKVKTINTVESPRYDKMDKNDKDKYMAKPELPYINMKFLKNEPRIEDEIDLVNMANKKTDRSRSKSPQKLDPLSYNPDLKKFEMAPDHQIHFNIKNVNKMQPRKLPPIKLDPVADKHDKEYKHDSKGAAAAVALDKDK